MLMPAFHRYPTEAGHIGRMLAGYGELEFLFAELVGLVLNDRDLGLRTYFRVGSESARISVADALTYHAIRAKPLELGNEYGSALGALRFCLMLRNRYAHCHWAHHPRLPGLFFTNLQDPAQKQIPMDYAWFHVDSTILSEQEEYFDYAQSQFTYLGETVRYHQEKRRSPMTHVEWPSYKPRPTEHNPQETHKPPWLPAMPDTPPSEPNPTPE